MSKLLLVGHPNSGLSEVEALLRQCGMAAAKPSKRECMLPQDINDVLRNAHQCPPVEHVTSEEGFLQVQPGAVWQGLALDLILGNLDQRLWGWADPGTIFLLDYWSSLDPQVTFVFVYDEPCRVLLEAAKGGQDDTHAVPRILENWQAYNAAMLRFYLRHAERCLLVNVQQARHRLDSYLHQLQGRTGAVLNAPAQATDEFPVEKLHTTLSGALMQAAMEPPELLEWFQGGGVLEQHLANEVLKQYPAALQMYEELQSAASLPLESRLQSHDQASAAWRSLLAQRTATVQLVSRLCEQLMQERAELQRQRDESARLLQHSSDLSQAEQARLQEQVTRMREQRDLLLQQKTEALRENALLFNQLHQVQEELERQLKTGQEALMQAQAMQRQAQTDRNSLQAAAQQAKDLAHENELMLAQLHQVQEELERFFIENQKLKDAAQVRKKGEAALYGAADRVRQQLSYRLGARMISQSRTFSGCVFMLPALLQEVKAFRLEQPNRQANQLPPLSAYADAREAERLKTHLSYRLGQVLMRHGRSPFGWMRMPFALHTAVRTFRTQRASQ